MFKFLRFFLSSILLFSLLSIFAQNEIFAQEQSKTKVKALFLDGSEIEVENLLFVYKWIYEKDEKYFNPPLHDKKSSGFHYSEVVKNIAIDRVLPREKLKNIKVVWDKKEMFNPKKIIITLIDGKEVFFDDGEHYLDATSSFLMDKPVDDISDVPKLRYVDVEGIGVVEGQRGKFAAGIRQSSGTHRKPSEAIKEIVFAVH
jgi:hypothetical protein